MASSAARRSASARSHIASSPIRSGGRVANLSVAVSPKVAYTSRIISGDRAHLAGDLVRPQVDVAVVLLELADPRQPGQGARHLVPVQHVEGAVADRQLAVGVLPHAVEQVMRGAVHRLEGEVVLPRLLVEHQEHVLPVLAPVPGALPEQLVVEQRRLDFLVARPLLQLADVVVDLPVDRRAPVGPERGARRGGMEHEEVELLAQPPVVALARLLEPVEVGGEVLLLEPRRAVDPLQHLAALVAAPVRPGAVQQLEVLEPSGRRDVRAAAEVLKRAVGVDGDHFVVAELADPLELERVVGEAAVGLRAVHDLALEGVVALRHLGHLLLDRLEVLRRERPGHVEVVVEAVLDRRAEPDAGAGEELAHRGGHDVGRAVPQHLEGGGVAIGEDGEGGVLLDRPSEIPDRPVDPRGHGRLGEPRPDHLRHLAAGRAGGYLAHRMVGQGQPDLRHEAGSCVVGVTMGSARGAYLK